MSNWSDNVIFKEFIGLINFCRYALLFVKLILVILIHWILCLFIWNIYPKGYGYLLATL